jgi:regulatory protein
MSVVTTLEIQKKNKERVNVYLDGEYAFSVDLLTAARLYKGQQLTEAEIAALKASDALSRAVDRAVRFLAYRPRSAAEVRRTLADKQTPDDVIEAAIEHLSKLGYLDDEAFANYWVENRSTFKPLSPRALRYELRQKGVNNADIEAALGDLDVNDAAYRAARTQIRAQRRKTRDAFRVKLNAFLQRRGFDFDVIRTVVEQLIAELEEEDPEYFLSDEE